MKGNESAVFEVVDYTDDDRYFPLGVFPSLKLAVKHIEQIENPENPISWHQQEELETITVIRREFGWSENGDRVLEINRVEYYDAEADEYFWKRLSVIKG